MQMSQRPLAPQVLGRQLRLAHRKLQVQTQDRERDLVLQCVCVCVCVFVCESTLVLKLESSPLQAAVV
jgi:hypothetical protein